MSNRKALLGKKLGMSQVWDENGFFVPVTLVDVSTNVVTAVKTEESDGYKAVQLGYGAIDPTKVTKPLAGHFAKAGVTPRRHLVEVRTDDVDQFEAGQELAADLFEEGAEVDVTGTTKGKGFAGTIKRWGFKSYRRTHGSHKNERRPGSVGACATPSRILKGKRMAGRMGHVTATTQNLTVVSADVENGILAIKGAIPGPKGGIVLVRSAVKGPQWYHGGTVFGPQPRDYSQRTPKKMKAAALRYALSDRANAGRVAVVEFGITEPSTKAAVAALAPITADKFTTVVFTRDNINEWLSVRNIPTVHPIFVDQLNTYDVITSQYVVFTKEAFEAFVAAKTEPKEA